GEGLVDVHDRARLEALGQRVSASLGGQEDDGDVLEARILLDLAADREPVHLRHHDVEEDEIEDAVFEDLERFRSPGGAGDVEPLLLEDRLLEVQDVLVVVDHEDPLRHRVPPRSRPGRERIIQPTRGPFNGLAVAEGCGGPAVTIGPARRWTYAGDPTGSTR